ncbi:hypothetical protein WJX72_006841 [[Myrmecia] bisecta]|uniref:UBC core domain-containing protein n=1 Tax=[Myrmecia] bisecta TaxID=41462 RepID=A0AAW1QS07_9CHLO
MDEDMEDAEMQRALAMSMMEVEGDASGASGDQDMSGEDLEAMLLEQAMILSMQGEAGAAAAPPAASAQGAYMAAQPVQPAARQQQPATPSRPLPPLPQWAQAAERWLPTAPETTTAANVAVPSDQEAAVTAALERVVNMKVMLVKGVQATPGPSGGALQLRLVKDSQGNLSQTPLAIDLAVKAYATSQGSPMLQAYCAVYTRAAAELASPAAPPVVQAVLRQWQARLAAKALELLGEDEEEDLYFEGGQQARQFLDGLVANTLQVPFLEGMLSASSSAKDVAAWEKLLTKGFAALDDASTLTNMQTANSKLYALSQLLQPALLQRGLMAMLLKEASNAPQRTGRQLEASSVLAPILSVSPIPDIPTAAGQKSPAKEFFTSLRGYPDRRGEVEVSMNGLRLTLNRCSEASHGILERIVRLKDPAKTGREAVLAWLAALAGANEVRAEAGEGRNVLNGAAIMKGASDRVMVGATATCLRFCKPFLGGQAKHLVHLDPKYYATQAHRVGSAYRDTTLAGRDAPPAEFSGRPFLSPDRDPGEAPHFVAECFFLTQRMIHTGLMPAVHRFEQMIQALAQRARLTGDDSKRPLEMWLLEDCTLAQLLDPNFASDAVTFMVLEAAWLLRIAQQDAEAAKAAFQLIPDSVVRDMASWLTFVIRVGHADLVAGVPIGPLVASLAYMLQRHDLVRSPLVRAKLVELLLAMLAPMQRRSTGGVLGPTYMRPGEAALVANILGSPAAQHDLVPALMHTYAAADHVVGLDVDKDSYDKFSMRHQIDLLIMELYKDAGCAASLTKLASASLEQPNGSLFAEYIGAVLNSLVYLLKDSLERLGDIHNIEKSQENEAAWKALPATERETKEQFKEGQGRTASGFMRMAVYTLKMLQALTENSAIRSTFLQSPLAGRAAYACIHFIGLLVGPQCTGLKVQNPEKYSFDPKKLLLQVCEVMLRLAQSEAFVAAISADADYDEALMQNAHRVLVGKQLGQYEHAARLEQLIAQVAQLRGQGSSSATASDVALPDLSFAAAEPANLEAEYVAALDPLAVGDFDSTATNAYNRAFAVMAEESAGDTQGKMKRLTRELRNLATKTQLPVHAASAIFVRHDPDRVDKMRALITGPEDTPYFGGCFVFDIYFPQDYPNVPPLLNMETNGEGRARFNPNLYADGKVCLSLLGTWHGSDASEKWNPATSNLFQILLSIQNMIFIPDPYFNEPNVESMRGKAEGDQKSNEYNAELQLLTMRWAMRGQLERLRPGFEDVVRAHFRLQRHAIMCQCAKWIKQLPDTPVGRDYRKKMVKELHLLHALLAKL